MKINFMLKRKPKRCRPPLKERGAALMLALFTTTLLMVVATEIMYETSVEYVVSTQAVNRVRAYWAARAGAEMSLLRIHIFRQAQSLAGGMIPNPSILDEIWKQPFLWPPPIPPGLSVVDSEAIKKAVKASDLTALKVSYFSTIESESAKIDVNDLGSPSKIMATAARNQILQIFQNKVENDEAFSKRYRGFDFNTVVNNIADWIDTDKESRNGGDEASVYSERKKNGFIPPNQPLKTLPELHLVEGMTDELYDVVAPSLTLYGGKGINVNLASKEVFYAFGPAFTPERVDRILKDRQDPKREPFKNEKEFVEYLNSIGLSGNPFGDGDAAKVPLVFDPETNFRIRSTGKAGQAQSDIVAIVYDQDKIRQRLEKALVDQAAKDQRPGGSGATSGTTPPPADPAKPGDLAGTPPSKDADKAKSPPPPMRRPKIVYWNEE